VRGVGVLLLLLVVVVVLVVLVVVVVVVVLLLLLLTLCIFCSQRLEEEVLAQRARVGELEAAKAGEASDLREEMEEVVRYLLTEMKLGAPAGDGGLAAITGGGGVAGEELRQLREEVASLRQDHASAPRALSSSISGALEGASGNVPQWSSDEWAAVQEQEVDKVLKCSCSCWCW